MTETIAFNEFQKLDLMIARIMQVEEIDGADKLYKLTLDAGPELGERTIAAGIKQFFAPEELIDRLVVYLANLEPRTLRGIESQGMLVAADDGSPVLLHPARAVAPGTRLR